jgi:HK97 family phage portal protein
MALSGVVPFVFWGGRRKVRVRVGEQLREIWRQAIRHGEQVCQGEQAGHGEHTRHSMPGGKRGFGAGGDHFEAGAEAERKTLAMPAILSPVQFPGRHLPKPTPANLRRFAETPVVRRAINVIKDRIAAMDWQIRVRRGVRGADVAFAERKLRALRRTLEEPNSVDSFRTLMEQAIEDALTGGFGAIEMEPTGDPERPAMLWAVDGASIRINGRWDGDPDTPRYAQAAPGQLDSSAVELRDDQLMYIRMNPRSFTPFGLGPLEVAFETVNQFLSAHRFAGKLAANAVAQYAIWINEATPAQHDRLIRWWQDEIEGTGRVPLISTQQKPEVLRFAQGTDADMRLAWQEFLIRMVANAFGLPPLMLGLEADVNQSTAAEMTDEAFRGAISPLAMLLAGHITRDLFGKCVGWREFEFVFNELNARDEETELAVQVQLLAAGVLTVNEVRAMRGLGPLEKQAGESTGQQVSELAS